TGQPEKWRPDGYAEVHLSALLDIRRESSCGLDSDVRRVLLHNRTIHRLERPDPNATGSAHALECQLRPGRSFLRRRSRTRHGWHSNGSTAKDRAVPHDGTEALRSDVRPRLDRRTLSGRLTKSVRNESAADGSEHDLAMRQRSPGRYVQGSQR